MYVREQEKQREKKRERERGKCVYYGSNASVIGVYDLVLWT